MHLLQYLAAGGFAIGFLILIHEAGHWAAARLLGIGVPIFSIGFGPRLFGFRAGGTDFRISALPFGGYAWIAGGDQFGEEDADAPPREVDASQSIANRPVWQRLFVNGAGPAVNLIVPYFMLIGVLLHGLPEAGNQLGEVLPTSAAEVVGLLPGDTVLAVNGHEVGYWNDIQDHLDEVIDHAAPIPVTVERDGARVDLSLPPHVITPDPDGRANLERLGIEAAVLTARVGVESSGSPAGRAGLKSGDVITAVDGKSVDSWRGLLQALSGTTHTLSVKRPFDVDLDQVTPSRKAPEDLTLTIDRAAGGYTSPVPAYANPWGLAPAIVMMFAVTPDSVAEKAGLKGGDRIAQADGQPMLTFAQLIHATRSTSVNGGPPREMKIGVVREGQLLSIALTPRLQVVDGRETRARPLIGVQSFGEVGRYTPTKVRPFTVAAAAIRSAETMATQIGNQFAILGNLLTGASSVEKNLGGPVAMFVAAGETASMGVVYYVTLLAAMSIGLGVINLLPVPVFDGGRITFDLIEAVRGRPVSIEVREKTMIASIVAVVLLMVYVTRNDLLRFIAQYFA
jgi:regulator of sigma E protease